MPAVRAPTQLQVSHDPTRRLGSVREDDALQETQVFPDVRERRRAQQAHCPSPRPAQVPRLRRAVCHGVFPGRPQADRPRDRGGTGHLYVRRLRQGRLRRQGTPRGPREDVQVDSQREGPRRGFSAGNAGIQAESDRWYAEAPVPTHLDFSNFASVFRVLFQVTFGG